MTHKPITARHRYLHTLKSQLQWYCQDLNLLQLVFTLGPPFLVIPGLLYVSLQWQTLLLTLILDMIGGICINAGYHRLWSHRSYQACAPLRYFLATFGAGSYQWSIMWWVRHHRAHHQYTDTDKDPYNAKRGFFYSHVGWLIWPKEDEWGEADISDLKNDPVVRWQQRNYVLLAALVNAVLPITIAHFGWNDWMGGFLYASTARAFMTLHKTFLVNSVAHASWAGVQPYSDRYTATNVLLLAPWSWGEGNHNYHHAFPADYRHGIQWYEIDLCKHFIELCACLGLAWDLNTTSPGIIHKAQGQQRGQQTMKGYDSQGPERLPAMKWDEYTERVRRGQCLVCVDNYVHDISSLVYNHPGGAGVLKDVLGKDGTSVFRGKIHSHSPIATAQLREMRIATIGDGVEWKVHSE